MRDLLKNPASRPSDLGQAMPESSHAVSVAMPLMEHVHGYEEGNSEVLDKLQTGYPRFFIHRSLENYFNAQLEMFGKEGEVCFCFPSERVALRALEYLSEQGRIQRIEHDIWALFIDSSLYSLAKDYWQHTGEIISSRRILEPEFDLAAADNARRLIRQRISRYSKNTTEQNVFLSPSGMASFFLALRSVSEDLTRSNILQVGFPYVDSLKLIEKFCSNHYLVSKIGSPGNDDRRDYSYIEDLVAGKKVDSVFVEFPTNATLAVVDLPRISKIARKYGVPLVVDDTIGSFFNLDLSEYADIVVSSLTKYFSGVGDVMAGSLVVNPNSPSFLDLQKKVEQQAEEDLLFGGDAIVLEKNSRNYEKNLVSIQESTKALVEVLQEHPLVETVLYPGLDGKHRFDSVRKDTGAYGGLFSIKLRNAKQVTQKFYDSLDFCKGPSLGTVFTIVCPYTLLAHYHELAWAESCGVSRDLVRVSVGLEPLDILTSRFQAALDSLENDG